MRIKTLAALGIATAAVGTGLAIGGVAYANSTTDPGDRPAIVLQDDGTSAAQYAPEDCPERSGGSSSESGSTAAPQESL
jgi:hypothetical protein